MENGNYSSMLYRYCRTLNELQAKLLKGGDIGDYIGGLL